MKRPHQRPLPKLTWPSVTTVIAVLALLLGIVQLAFTVPVLTQYYIKPDLVVSGGARLGAKGKAELGLKEAPAAAKKALGLTSYLVVNEGNAAATKIEIGFLDAADSKVTVVPSISANIVQDSSGWLKTVRVEVERLSAGETFTVHFSPGASRKPSPEAEFFRMNLPTFSFVRSAEGPGRYIPAEGEKGYWSGTKR